MTRAAVVAQLRLALRALDAADRAGAHRIIDQLRHDLECQPYRSREAALDALRRDMERLADERAQEIVEARA